MDMKTQMLDEGLLAGLGLIVVQCSVLDGFLQEYVSYLLRANRTSMYIVTQSVSISTQSTWARVLTQDYLREPHKTEALEILAASDEVRAERNTLVHGLWERGAEPATALVQTVRLDRAEIIRNELVTHSDLNELSRHIMETTERFAALAEKLGFAQA